MGADRSPKGRAVPVSTLRLTALLLAAAALSSCASAPPAAPAYRNPILFADYSDPDAIRVGDDYYMVASSFSFSPKSTSRSVASGRRFSSTSSTSVLSSGSISS